MSKRGRSRAAVADSAESLPAVCDDVAESREDVDDDERASSSKAARSMASGEAPAQPERLVFLMQTAAETREFIASLATPVTDEESDATVARAEEWTARQMRCTDNFGPRLIWSCTQTTTKKNSAYISFTASILDANGCRRETAIPDIITPVFNTLASSAFLGHHGNLIAPKFPADWNAVSRSLPFVTSTKSRLGPATTDSQAGFISSLEHLQYDELCPIANAISTTPRPIAEVVRELKEAKAGSEQPVVKHIGEGDKRMSVLRLRSIVTPRIDVPFERQAPMVAAAIKTAEAQWDILEADDEARRIYGKGGFCLNSSGVYSMLRSFRRDVAEDHSEDVKPWFPHGLHLAPIRVMMSGNRPRILSHDSIDALERGNYLNNFVAYASLKVCNWHKRVPKNVPLYWNSITLFGRVIVDFSAPQGDSSDSVGF